MNLKLCVLLMLTACVLCLPLSLSAKSTPPVKACPDTFGLVVVGEAEYVTLKSKELRLKARIDTGAQTSSLGVVDEQPFERDGKKWLQFSVLDPGSGEKIKFERPVVRIAEIKRHGAESQKRHVVMLTIMLGNIEMKREFTLADRSRYTFPVLIGRNVLTGQFLVDVNRKYSTQLAGGEEE